MIETLSLSKEAIIITIIASAPAILASLIVGLIIALFSATTQIQEQTLSFAPKMIAVFFALLFFGSRLGDLIVRYTKACFLACFNL